MESRFSPEFFAANRRKLKSLFTGKAPIVVTANGLLQRGGDNSFAFAQDANFWYLTGIDEPDIILVIDRDREYLIIPTLSPVRQAFDGHVVPEDLIKRSGVATVLEDKAGWEQLGGRLKKVKHLATLSPPAAYLESHGLYSNPARANLVARLKAVNNDLELLDLSLHLARLRMIKQPEELAAIKVAIAITIQGLKTTLRPAKLASYSFEYQIEAELSRAFRSRGALGHAFSPVVASGPRACTMHYVANNAPLTRSELIVVDAGAEVEHYAADITRTVIVGEPSRRQQAVYNAVLAGQDYARSLLRPGCLLKDYEAAVEHFMGEKLRELGLIKTITHENVRAFYPHATSHFLGLNVHDVGDYSRPLEPGMVLAVEPGIYIPKEGLGVRLEDDVLITPMGHKNLSSALPKALS